MSSPALSPTVALTIDLMKEPSVTPFDANCQTMMIQRLEAIGFRVERHLSFGLDYAEKFRNLPYIGLMAD